MTTLYERLRKLDEEATEGPWVVHKGGYEIEDRHEDLVIGSFAAVGFGARECKTNTRLTAEARNNLSALLDVVQAAQWLGVHPEYGYCFCFGAKKNLAEDEHTGECRDMRDALAPLMEDVDDG